MGIEPKKYEKMYGPHIKKWEKGKESFGPALYIASGATTVARDLFSKCEKTINQDPGLFHKHEGYTAHKPLKEEQEAGTITGLKPGEKINDTCEYSFNHNGTEKTLLEIGGEKGYADKYSIEDFLEPGQKLSAVMTGAAHINEFDMKKVLANVLPHLEEGGLIVDNQFSDIFHVKGEDGLVYPAQHDQELLKSVGLELVANGVMKKVEHKGNVEEYQRLLSATSKDEAEYLAKLEEKEATRVPLTRENIIEGGLDHPALENQMEFSPDGKVPRQNVEQLLQGINSILGDAKLGPELTVEEFNELRKKAGLKPIETK
ncbi:MAG: hypothetical protein KAW41_02730 [Candidatus Diapherotrites archaeon]|nr:hypothetical protein [Candidatus Diapherotrites archaeon]